MKGGLLVLLACASLNHGLAFAESGADALLGAVTPSGAAAQQTTASNQLAIVSGAYEVKLTDPFLMQFFADWRSQKSLPYEVNSWAALVVQQKFEQAAHLWSIVQDKAPESFGATANAARLYLLFRLDLPQTLVNQLVAALGNSKWADSRAFVALAQVLGQAFDRWIVEKQLTPSPVQESLITALPKRGVLESTLKAWALLRKGEAGLAVLDELSEGHALKIPLSQTVALALARRGDLPGAAGVLKRHVEPALDAKHDPKALATHYLQIARLLYQAGALDGAETYYSKVPNGSGEYLKAQEELTWIWLRKGDVGMLRGALTTLSLKVFSERFAPEVYLVRAISNLKLCYYDEAKKDFDAFVASNRSWVTRISSAIGSGLAPKPEGVLDGYSQLAESRIAVREAEAARLEALGQQSITATLPAVGPQQHWTQARSDVLATVERLKKDRDSEYRRCWRNHKFALEEAIRKMRFVKVELLSQSRALAHADSIDRLRLTSARAEAEQRPGKEKIPEGDMNFPFDGVIWPDELFRLHSTAQGRCLQPGGEKK